MISDFSKPSPAELTPYQQTYIGLVPDGNLIGTFQQQLETTIKFIESIPAEKLSYRYAENKWSVKQVLTHITDTERIFQYRMLCIARGEKGNLPGFEENDYAKASPADELSVNNIIEEFKSVRNATISLLKNFNDESFNRKGTANNKETSVKRLAFMLAGHEIHHLNVIKTKYLI